MILGGGVLAFRRVVYPSPRRTSGARRQERGGCTGLVGGDASQSYHDDVQRILVHHVRTTGKYAVEREAARYLDMRELYSEYDLPEITSRQCAKEFCQPLQPRLGQKSKAQVRKPVQPAEGSSARFWCARVLKFLVYSIERLWIALTIVNAETPQSRVTAWG
ncbi:hypothetical protein BD310DRAFT_245953 [Dichomitus squalens]|uniref:Uncharacterized protein n=1 Tax=Dichomitus squalens TaxID=114155 RepID=A0A4V2K6H6_9APHY|nr:hypothetical protein BD310DRAFT_245953 [Dichomitus squalens]